MLVERRELLENVICNLTHECSQLYLKIIKGDTTNLAEYEEKKTRLADYTIDLDMVLKLIKNDKNL